MGLDILCQMGPSPCGAAKNPILKNFCELVSGDNSDPCKKPRPQYYEECTVANVSASKGDMPCYPGSNKEILEKYRQWPNRITS